MVTLTAKIMQGSGAIQAYINNVMVINVSGSAGSGGSTSCSAGDSFEIRVIASSGYTFQKLCDVNGANCTTSVPVYGTVGTANFSYGAYFVTGGGDGVCNTPVVNLIVS